MLGGPLQRILGACAASLGRLRLRHALGLALALRVGLWLSAWAVTGSSATFYSPDTESYLIPARELLGQGSFTHEGLPEIVRTPGYPLLLLPGLLAGAVEPVTIALQIALSVATVWLVHRVALAAGGSVRTANLAALLYAIEPLSVLYSVTLLTETLFSFLIVAFVWLLLDYLDKPSLRKVILTAGALSASVYVRPAALYLPIPVCLGLLVWWAWQRKLSGIRIAQAVALLACCVALAGAWQVRNASQTGYRGFSSISVTNLALYLAGPIEARRAGIPFYRYLQDFSFRDVSPGSARDLARGPRSLAQDLDAVQTRALRTIGQEPVATAAIVARGVIRVALDPGADQLLKLYDAYPQQGGLLGKVIDQGLFSTLDFIARERRALLTALLAFGVLLLSYYVAAAWGLWRAASERALLVVLVLVAAYFLIIAGSAGSVARFRHPIMPMLAVVAAFGYGELMSRAKRT